MTHLPDISELVISMEDVIEKLNAILTDSIILRADFSIESLSSSLEILTGFAPNELTGKKFDSLSTEKNLNSILRDRLKQGYFENLSTCLITKSRTRIRVSISGFYLGLISEINGFVILKIKPAEDVLRLKKELSSQRQELDSFIYRTAHDLRGPLATIKGLINLLKLRKDNEEVDELTMLIEVHANKLDDRLFKLLYLANVNSMQKNTIGSLCFKTLHVTLQKLLDDNCQLEKSMFNFSAPEEDLSGVNEQVITHLISNVFLYIISLPVASIANDAEVEIDAQFKIKNGQLDITITSIGFLIEEHVQNIIVQPTTLYNDLLSHPFLFNYYVALKNAAQLNSSLTVSFTNNIEQKLQVSVPLQNSVTQPDVSLN
ncbi:MAG TPA: hypothetical protein PKK67_03485 [Cyclobacteriaceae bacterium]|nr:hypothetical protein [Cytophagales bacterium]HMR55695.1 hypothetical protein [Cyclobacteriaceae bacterium]HNT49623.1 hypothetical protein [Cyclobacteriaceae bacterium]HRE67688.1 hypothetical protein [Cyclobacteriaceae bacterium]HRG09926.1 hypothetical protein [Cyclobacteriaceae bacterium]